MRNTHRMNNIQRQIVDALHTKHMTISELREVLPVSEVYIRQQLNLLEQIEKVEKVDTRQPYMYMPKRVDLPKLERMNEFRACLKDKTVEPKKNKAIIKLLQATGKSSYPVMAIILREIAEVIDEMEENGELIETLAD